jgi:prevent-host-death family protein
MITVNIRAAKANLSSLLARVEAGEEIVIARGKTPVTRLTPVRSPPASRRFGVLKVIISVSPEFFAPLTESDLGGWERRLAGGAVPIILAIPVIM